MTRYPKSGRGRKWTVAELKAIGAPWRGDSLADSDGLVGTVRTGDAEAITVHWRYAFKREGRVAWHYCGTWPLVSLEGIRAARDAARDALKAAPIPRKNDTPTASRRTSTSGPPLPPISGGVPKTRRSKRWLARG